MAKLNGVKTIDMVNGEITKVAYNGAEYTKVEATRETAKVGDLFLATSAKKDITPGAFYKVIYDRYDRNAYSDVTILDDANDTHDTSLQYGIFFRKISAISPTIEERVTALESDVATLKGEKASETIEFEGATYRKVYREAREGDVVIFRENTSCCGSTNVPYLVTEEREGKPYLKAVGINVYHCYYGRSRETVDVYEPAKYVPQVGDIVVVTDDSASGHKLGDVGRITEIDDDCFRVTVPGGMDRGNWLLPKRFRKATPVEVEQYEQAVYDANKPKLKAGDFVKITRVRSHYDNTKVYEIVEESGELGVIDEDGDFNGGAIAEGKYEIVDAETAKWAKIGREVNEFKRGDIAEVVEYNSGHKVGTIVEITHLADRGGDFRAKALGSTYFYSPQRLKLIAPVESTLN